MHIADATETIRKKNWMVFCWVLHRSKESTKTVSVLNKVLMTVKEIFYIKSMTPSFETC